MHASNGILFNHESPARIEPNQQFVLHYGDMTDATNLIRIVQETQPDKIYVVVR